MLSFRHKSYISNNDVHAYSVEHNGGCFGDACIDDGNVLVLAHNGDGRDCLRQLALTKHWLYDGEKGSQVFQFPGLIDKKPEIISSYTYGR